ncbi:MAG: hypothetical protein JKX93_03970 [Rhizobiaceae bacterium]|nr:hypothetical protein [Rhizobiaceae bacterium]
MSRTLYTLACPTLASADRETIESFRRKHDLPFRDVVTAHFTMVFGRRGFDESRYIDHIKEIATAFKPINFVCRYAMLGVDDENNCGYVFLVPDEGRKVTQPMLALWGANGTIEKHFDCLALWRERAENVQGHASPARTIWREGAGIGGEGVFGVFWRECGLVLAQCCHLGQLG